MVGNPLYNPLFGQRTTDALNRYTELLKEMKIMREDENPGLQIELERQQEIKNLKVQQINEQKADLILFTGDLVNDLSTETDEFKDIIAGLKAPMGVYSILGNHDYGDYYQWNSVYK